MKKQIILFCLSVGLSTTLWADQAILDCTFLDIFLTNTSSHTCTLINGKLLSGALWTEVPERLVLGSEEHIRLSEADNQGPKIQLEYDCGGKKIAFTSEQSVCKWSAAGKVSGQVISADPGIKANYDVTEGSVFLVLPGSIDWALTR